MIAEILRARELLYFLSWRDVKIRYKQTLLGAAWAVLQPLAAMLIFTLVFARMGNFSTADIPPPLFYYTALVPWLYFAGAITNAGNSLVANTDLITKVYFPRALLPASTVLAGLVDLLIAATLMLGLLAFYGIVPDAEVLAWPLAVAALVMLALGGGMAVAAVNVVYRDVKYALPFAVQSLLFLSPVIYPMKDLEGPLRMLNYANPLSGILETCRASVVPSIPVDWIHFGISAALSAVVFLAGATYFKSVERRFADLV